MVISNKKFQNYSFSNLYQTFFNLLLRLYIEESFNCHDKKLLKKIFLKTFSVKSSWLMLHKV